MLKVVGAMMARRMSDLAEVTEADLAALEIGSGILGHGRRRQPLYRQAARRAGAARRAAALRLPLEDLPDDAQVVSLGGIGAPVVGFEKIKEGREGLRALRTLEDRLGFRADAAACEEIGGQTAWSR
jgi:DUF917 family protein